MTDIVYATALGITPPTDSKLKLPLKWDTLQNKDIYLSDALDAISIALHSGKLTRGGWLNECFTDIQSFNNFTDDIENYTFYIHSFWYTALLSITYSSECDMLTNEDIAYQLRNAASNIDTTDTDTFDIEPLPTLYESVLELPLKSKGGKYVSEKLDAIANAVYSNKITHDNWINELFVDEMSFETFLEELRDCLLRIHSHWFYALLELTCEEEESCLSNEDLANELRNSAKYCVES